MSQNRLKSLTPRRRIAVLKGFNYETIKEAAKRINKHPSIVSHLASNDKIPGAMKFSGVWLIPISWKHHPKYRGKAKAKDEPLALKDPSKFYGNQYAPNLEFLDNLEEKRKAEFFENNINI